MKKVIFTTICIIMVALLTACSANEKDNSENSTDTSVKVSEMSENENNKQNDISVSSSSISVPLSINNWGNASKYSTKEQGYYNIPIRITALTKGKKASEIVKKFMDKSASYTYTEPDKNAEWIVADYEISLDGFPVDKGGVDTSITSFVTGTDGNYMEYGDKKWSTTTVNITDGKYYYEGNVKGQIAYQMLTGRTDYVITLGEYNETQAFFSENNNENSAD